MKKIISILILVVVVTTCFTVSGCNGENVDYSYSRGSMSVTKPVTSATESKKATVEEMIARTHVDITALNNKVVSYKNKQGVALSSLKVKNYVVDISVEQVGLVDVTIGIIFEKVYDKDNGENVSGFVMRAFHKPNDIESEEYQEREVTNPDYKKYNLSVGEGFVYEFIFHVEYKNRDRYFKIELSDFEE